MIILSDFAETIIMKELASIVIDVFIGIIIFLTMPVTSASTERVENIFLFVTQMNKTYFQI